MLEKAMTTVKGMSWTPEEMTEEPRTWPSASDAAVATHTLEELRQQEVDRHKHKTIAEGSDDEEGGRADLHHTLTSARSRLPTHCRDNSIPLGSEVMRKRGYEHDNTSDDDPISRCGAEAMICRAGEPDN